MAVEAVNAVVVVDAVGAVVDGVVTPGKEGM